MDYAKSGRFGRFFSGAWNRTDSHTSAVNNTLNSLTDDTSPETLIKNIIKNILDHTPNSLNNPNSELRRRLQFISYAIGKPDILVTLLEQKTNGAYATSDLLC